MVQPSGWPAAWFKASLAALSQTAAALVDLVLPADCAGCGQPVGPGGAVGICDACLAVLRVQPALTRPQPPPPGLPPCITVGEYTGALRGLVLAYKEKGRRGLCAPLGDTLADAVLVGMTGPPQTGQLLHGYTPATVRAVGTLVLVPVPSTAAAIRARHGDHMLCLAERAARRLGCQGWPAEVARPLRALRRVDSAGLDRHARATLAEQSITLGSGRLPSADATVVLLDDVVTTGATLAAAATMLARAGVPPAFAATLAATRLRLGTAPLVTAEREVPPQW